jgi:hypothetical protein
MPKIWRVEKLTSREGIKAESDMRLPFFLLVEKIRIWKGYSGYY